MSTDRYLPIDEEGYFVFDGRRVDDESLGALLLDNIRPVERNRFVTSMDGQDAWIEAFDAPLVARGMRVVGDGTGGVGEIDLPYHCKARFEFSTLTVDEWDRFHGWTVGGVPFVFTRGAQVEFFDLLDAFDDESVTIRGRVYATPPWLSAAPAVDDSGFWNGIYVGPEQPWDLGEVTPVLPSVLPQLKLSKSRVLVLGCGSGHDAAYLARQGHSVTAVDFSEEALQRARGLYGSVEGLQFVARDAFALPEEWTGRFDLIFFPRLSRCFDLD